MSALPQRCQQGTPAQHTPTVLVVEDEVLVRLMIARHLRAHGFRVIEASDSGEALDALESAEPINILFTDVIMPGVMNGVMLARWVKQNRPDIAILLTSAWAEYAQNLPDERLFPKPYDPDEVESQIRRLLPHA